MTDTLPTAEQVCDLPDDLREPLHSLSADIRYLFGRVAADGALASMMADSAVSRLSQIEEASYRLNALITAQAADIKRLTEATRWNGPGDQPLPEDEAIAAVHPVNSGDHAGYAEAMRLVGAKRSKGALVNLIHWSVRRAETAEASLAALKAERDAMRTTLEWMLARDDENGSLPPPYREKIDAALSLDAQGEK